MKRFSLALSSLCLILLYLLPSQPAWSTENEVTLEGDQLQHVFFDLLTTKGALAKQDIIVKKFSATPQSVTVPTGSLDFQIISGLQPGKPLGQQTIITDVLVDGVAQKRIKLSGDLALFGDVICTTSALPRKSIILAQHIKRVRQEITMLGPDIITDESAAIGKELTTTLQAGSILYGKTLKEPELVKRGDIISILATNDLLTVSVPGRVLKSGAKGEIIKVKNLMSRKEIFATIIGPSTVQTQF
ncbi:MAG: flagellar basal body P-ring formation chaperone FlgA [Desulfobulbaceae bacterium]|nr:flagellar basal body P-ring formation chaperone FlgA [Desulfobulbaceae bacterium]